MILIILFVLLGTIILISMGRTYKIPKDDYELIPYAGNEILIFESNKGEIDTIFLQGIERMINPTDPLDIFPTKVEYYYVINKHSDPSPPNGKHRYLEGHILVELSANKKNDTGLKINLSAKNARFYGSAWLTKSELERMPTINLKIKGTLYEDVKVFEDIKKEYYERSNYINKLYWSMSGGIVRYDKKDNELWELKKK